jgi:hypothetical protein
LAFPCSLTLPGTRETLSRYRPTPIWTTDDCFNQEWPQLIVQNLTFEDGYSSVQQTATSFYGGGAIYAEGGQLKVVNSRFIANRCFKTGPDLGGAAIRSLAQWRNRPVYITSDTPAKAAAGSSSSWTTTRAR